MPFNRKRHLKPSTITSPTTNESPHTPPPPSANSNPTVRPSLPKRAFQVVRKQIAQRATHTQPKPPRPATIEKENACPVAPTAARLRPMSTKPGRLSPPWNTASHVRPKVPSSPPTPSPPAVIATPEKEHPGVGSPTTSPASIKHARAPFVAGKRVSPPRPIPTKTIPRVSSRPLPRSSSSIRHSESKPFASPVKGDTIPMTILKPKSRSEKAMVNIPIPLTETSASSEEPFEAAIPAEPPSASPPATRTFGDYRILSHLGTGSFGEVKLAMHISTKRAYAIKIVSKAVMEEQDAPAEMMLAEQRYTREVTGVPFQLGLKASFHDSANFYLAMEYCSSDLHEEWHSYDGHVPLPVLICWSSELACAIQHLHAQGVIHRDLKLENVLVRRDGHLFLADYAFAGRLEPAPVPRQTLASNATLQAPPALRYRRGGKEPTAMGLCGSPPYVAPEVWRREAYTYSVDWFAYGVMLHVLHVNEFPWKGNSTEETRDAILTRSFEITPMANSNMKFLYLIESLLRARPQQRADFACVQNSDFFTSIGLDWSIINSGLACVPPPRARGTPVMDTSIPVSNAGRPYGADADPHPQFSWLSPDEEDDDEAPIVDFCKPGDVVSKEEEFSFGSSSSSACFVPHSPVPDAIILKTSIRSLDAGEEPIYEVPEAWRSAFARTSSTLTTLTDVEDEDIIAQSIRSLAVGEKPVLQIPEAWKAALASRSTFATSRSESPSTEATSLISTKTPSSCNPPCIEKEVRPVLKSVTAWWKRAVGKA